MDPKGNRAGWERLRNWIPYPELPTRRYVSRQVCLLDDGRNFLRPGATAEGDDYAGLRSEVRRLIGQQITGSKARRKPFHRMLISFVDQEMVLRYYPQAGWTDSSGSGSATQVYYEEIDWVMQARENWSTAIREAMRVEMPGRRQIHHGNQLVGLKDKVGPSPMCHYSPMPD